MQKLKPLDPSLPIWQSRIVRTVDKIVDENLVEWGRIYAGFLARQLQRIDDAIGKAPIRLPNLKRRQYEQTQALVAHVARQHPDATREWIALTLGISVPTVDRHLRVARVLIEPERPARPRVRRRPQA